MNFSFCYRRDGSGVHIPTYGISACIFAIQIHIRISIINNRKSQTLVFTSGRSRASQELLVENGSSLVPLTRCYPHIWAEGVEWTYPACIKAPVGEKSMVLCVHPSPSLKTSRVAIWGGIDATGDIVVLYQLYLKADWQ